ncbi:hypothetical protein FA15DRAFT_698566 [Coprinopsis marcescibilis]|uniref:Uncharacterized protein n=1 Tax=Coprinopsis marcescibilis TaxID=230819 RepID=A0A5C3KB65_COPMA|nr:hypothetical protein FA15DRAFT_698566 [Coprinopsis marcescibilis]
MGHIVAVGQCKVLTQAVDRGSEQEVAQQRREESKNAIVEQTRLRREKLLKELAEKEKAKERQVRAHDKRGKEKEVVRVASVSDNSLQRGSHRVVPIGSSTTVEDASRLLRELDAPSHMTTEPLHMIMVERDFSYPVKVLVSIKTEVFTSRFGSLLPSLVWDPRLSSHLVVSRLVPGSRAPASNRLARLFSARAPLVDYSPFRTLARPAKSQPLHYQPCSRDPNPSAETSFGSLCGLTRPSHDNVKSPKQR